MIGHFISHFPNGPLHLFKTAFFQITHSDKTSYTWFCTNVYVKTCSIVNVWKSDMRFWGLRFYSKQEKRIFPTGPAAVYRHNKSKPFSFTSNLGYVNIITFHFTVCPSCKCVVPQFLQENKIKCLAIGLTHTLLMVQLVTLESRFCNFLLCR